MSLSSRIVAVLPADDMVWFVFQVLRSSEEEFGIAERKEILERMTQIFAFELDPFSNLLNQIWIDYFGETDLRLSCSHYSWFRKFF